MSAAMTTRRLPMRCWSVAVLTALAGVFCAPASAQPAALTSSPVDSASDRTSEVAAKAVASERIRFIHMGGNDCPPCVAWRGLELPKLEKSPAFLAIQNSYVVKTIRSPVPSAFFLPAEVKPLKSRLDRASAGKSGSPHQMLLVDGEVYDYWFGTLDAAQIEAKIAAITGGSKYPGPRCTRLSDQSVRVCAEPH